MQCQRCANESSVFKYSFLNLDKICPACQKKEALHPSYELIKEIERMISFKSIDNWGIQPDETMPYDNEYLKMKIKDIEVIVKPKMDQDNYYEFIGIAEMIPTKKDS